MALICHEKKWLFIMIPATGCSSVREALLNKFNAEYLPENHIYQEGKIIVDRKHNSISDLIEHKLIAKKELKSYLKFATVRNPFDKLVTHYERHHGSWWDTYLQKREQRLTKDHVSEEEKTHIIQQIAQRKKDRPNLKNMNFNTWIENWIGAPPGTSLFDYSKQQLHQLFTTPYYTKLYPGICGVDELIRFEHMEEDLNKLLIKTGKIHPDEWINIPHTNPTPGKKDYRTYYNPKTVELMQNKFAKALAKFDYTFEGLSKKQTA